MLELYGYGVTIKRVTFKNNTYSIFACNGIKSIHFEISELRKYCIGEISFNFKMLSIYDLYNNKLYTNEKYFKKYDSICTHIAIYIVDHLHELEKEIV